VFQTEILPAMFLSNKTVLFACLSLASVGASLSNGDLLKKIEEQNEKIEVLKKVIEQLVDDEQLVADKLEEQLDGDDDDNNDDDEWSSDETRHLKKKKKKPAKRMRNICYSTESHRIETWLECSARVDDDDLTGSGWADCNYGSRRLLSHDEARKNVQEFKEKRELCGGPPGQGYEDGDSLSEFGFYEVGDIKMGKE
jgi:hypothetical protein